MSRQDTEIEHLKARVSCAVLLERLPPVWRLDVRESTRRSLKYRRGAGEIVIVNHDGHGWWDPLSQAKGDIFSLVRHLDPGLTFGDARRVLLGFVGIAPSFPVALRPRRTRVSHLPVVQRWGRRRTLSRGSPAWRYLAERRGLPETILMAAHAADVVREGPHGSAWFAHRDDAGQLTGIEMRGCDYRNFSAGGEKTLFRLPGGPGPLLRITVCEAAIDALSLAAIEHGRDDTLYTATAGGMGPATIAALEQLLPVLAADPAGLLVAATDADTAGRRYASRLASLAAQAGVRFEVILPPDGLNDWNDAMRAAAPGAIAPDRVLSLLSPAAGGEQAESKSQRNRKENPKPEDEIRSFTASPSVRGKGASLRSRGFRPPLPRPAGMRSGRGVSEKYQEGHPDEQDKQHSRNREPWWQE
jgi:hypothetical protein